MHLGPILSGCEKSKSNQFNIGLLIVETGEEGFREVSNSLNLDFLETKKRSTEIHMLCFTFSKKQISKLVGRNLFIFFANIFFANPIRRLLLPALFLKTYQATPYQSGLKERWT